MRVSAPPLYIRRCTTTAVKPPPPAVQPPCRRRTAAATVPPLRAASKHPRGDFSAAAFPTSPPLPQRRRHTSATRPQTCHPPLGRLACHYIFTLLLILIREYYPFISGPIRFDLILPRSVSRGTYTTHTLLPRELCKCVTSTHRVRGGARQYHLKRLESSRTAMVSIFARREHDPP